jgi:hypothetical protein
MFLSELIKILALLIYTYISMMNCYVSIPRKNKKNICFRMDKKIKEEEQRQEEEH